MRHALLLLALVLPAPAAAQGLMPTTPHRGSTTAGWVEDFTLLSANVLLSGLTAGLRQELRGGSFRDGFTRGAAGGGAVYAGKRIAAGRFAGAGLLGRQVGAVGGSVVWNAAEGRGSLSRLMVPLGPARLYVRTGAEAGVIARADLHTLFWMVHGVLEPELRLDVGRSLSAGAPVFHAPGHSLVWSGIGEAATGFTPAGVVFLGEPSRGTDLESLFAHERIHVLQDDHLFLLAGDPLEGWILSRIPGGRVAARYVDLNLGAFLLVPLALRMEYETRPWELEARVLTEEP